MTPLFFQQVPKQLQTVCQSDELLLNKSSHRNRKILFAILWEDESVFLLLLLPEREVINSISCNMLLRTV